MPAHVSVVDSENVDQLAEVLSKTGSIITCVPAPALPEATVSLAKAFEFFPPVESTQVDIAGAVGLDDGKPASFTQEPTAAQQRSLPVMVFSHGVGDNGTLLVRSFTAAHPIFKSCFSVLAPPLANHWLQAAMAAPCLEPAEWSVPGAVTHATPAPKTPKGHFTAFPRLVVGPSAAASLKSYDVVSRTLNPLFDTKFVSCEAESFDGADMVDFCGMVSVVSGYCGGLVASVGGQGSLAAVGATTNCLNAAGKALRKLNVAEPMPMEAIVTISSFAGDADCQSHRLARRQADLVDPLAAAAQLYRTAGQSPHFTNVQRTAAYLGGHSGFYDGVSQTVQGELRAASVAETVGSSSVDWKRTNASTQCLFHAAELLTNAALHEGATRTTFAQADDLLRKGNR